MSFTDWYESVYKEKWHEDFGFLYSFANEKIEEYELYCQNNNIESIYNG